MDKAEIEEAKTRSSKKQEFLSKLSPKSQKALKSYTKLVKTGKKNSKTTGGGAIMVTALLMNRRPNAEYLFVGPTQDISDIAFSQAKGMIEPEKRSEGWWQPVIGGCGAPSSSNPSTCQVAIGVGRRSSVMS